MPSFGFPLGSAFDANATTEAVVAAIATAAIQPRDIHLDDGGDWELSAGDLVLCEGLESIRQDVQMRLQFFLGEWFADESAGMPYFTGIMVKNPNLTAIRTFFRNEIQNTLGVADVTKIELKYTARSRSLRIAWAATTDLGRIDGTVEVGA